MEVRQEQGPLSSLSLIPICIPLGAQLRASYMLRVLPRPQGPLVSANVPSQKVPVGESCPFVARASLSWPWMEDRASTSAAIGIHYGPSPIVQM